MPYALIWIFTSIAALTHVGFESVTSKHGVDVYKRKVSSGVELAAQGVIAAPPERVRAVLLDYEHHSRWNKHLRTSQVLVRGPSSLVVYQRLDLPILDDRDYTLAVEWGGDPGGTLWLRFTTTDAGPPPQHGVVRIHTHEGEWRLEPTDGGKATLARYHFRLDLAGSMPGWMARGRMADDVPALFDSIREQVR